MPANKPEYYRKYNRERKVQVYPATKDLAFIKKMQIQKPGMSRSAVAKYLIGLGVQSLLSQKNSF